MTAATKAADPIILYDDHGLTIEGLNALREPTPIEEIKQRPAPGGSGKMLDYVDARFVMDRLDTMAGPMNWQTQYEDVAGGGVRCTLAIRVLGTWIHKTDVGDASTIEPIKGAHSDALKRAAVQWGVARDLYDAREDTYAPRPAAPPRTAAAPTYPTSPTARQAMGGGIDPAVVNPTNWRCPIHGSVKIMPGGVSMKTGVAKPYPPFAACGESGPPFCNERPPRVAATPAPTSFIEEPLPFFEDENYS